MRHILITTPSAGATRTGNRVTAERWRQHLRALGHKVTIAEGFAAPTAGDDFDLLVALHARRGADSILAFREYHTERPIVLALTGTDLYRDLPECEQAQRSLELADRIVVLQENALERLQFEARSKAVVIHQSLPRPEFTGASPIDVLKVVQVGHLRPVKDPLLILDALSLLDADSRVHVQHIGAGLDPDLTAGAVRANDEQPRYRWLGERSREETLQLLTASHLLVHPSRLEGGANAVSEAIVCGVPVLATAISGSIGLLGADYSGYFPVSDAAALAQLLTRAEGEAGFLPELRAQCAERAGLFEPQRERDAWRQLIAELNRG